MWGIYHLYPIKQFDYTDNWILQKAYSLNQFPLTVSIFERYPTMVSTLPKYFAQTQYARGMKISGYGGVDGLILGNLAEKMDFLVNVIQPLDAVTYGFKRGSKFTGAIGDVMEGRADMAFNSRFLIIYGAYNTHSMVPILADYVCVVIPAAEKTPQWKAIFRCFDAYFWFTFIFITSISGAILSFLKFYHEKQKRRVLHDSYLYKDYKNLIGEEKRIEVENKIWTIVNVMAGVVTNLPIETIERLLIGSCLLAHIIIGGSFGVYIWAASIFCSTLNASTLIMICFFIFRSRVHYTQFIRADRINTSINSPSWMLLVSTF